MDRVSRSYRFAALVGLIAIAWAVALPVVHMACAGEFMAALAREDHGTAGQTSDCHGAADSTSSDPDDGSYPAPVDMSCCLVGMSPIEGTVAPVSLVKNLKMAAAVVDVHRAESPISYSRSSVGGRSAPSLPAPSHLFFSVLLI